MRRIVLALLLLTLAVAASAQTTFAQTGAPAEAKRVRRTSDEIGAVEARVRSAASPRAAADAIPSDLLENGGLREKVRNLRQGREAARAEALQVLGALRIAAETTPDPRAAERVRQIKSGAEYRTAKAGTASNWYQRLLEGLSKWIGDTFRNMFRPNTNINAPDVPNVSLPGWIVQAVWVLLAVVVLVAAWPLIRLIRFRVERRKRKAKGILEEEPERTKSEYLSLADRLAAEGDFRGAIRMSYLAALKRFDEARVARFDRGETNWEHLARIRSAPTLPAGLDFRPATAAFDHYWYGKRPALRADYERFVGWYDEVDVALRKVAA